MKRIVAVALACLIVVPGIAIASPATLAQTRHAASSSIAGPTFTFPVNGTAYPSNGPYVFQVQPVNGAVGYLWSFVQGGLIAYQNLAWDGHLSPASYTISTRSKAHSLIHAGDLHVWVRVLMKDGTWSATGAVLVRIQGKGGPHPGPRPTSTSGHPTPGTVLYSADTSGGFDRWTTSKEWKLFRGMLVNDGSNQDGLLMPPFQPSVADYAVEVDIQVLPGQCNLNSYYYKSGFGIGLRLANQTGYWSGPDCAGSDKIYYGSMDSTVDMGAHGFDPGTDWHTYRFAVKGNTLQSSVDGTVLIQVTDNRLIGQEAGQIGLYYHNDQINIRSFKVIAL